MTNSLRRKIQVLFLIPGLFFSGFVPAEAAAAGKGTVRIVSWNIEWFPGKSRTSTAEEQAAHTELVRGELKKMDPDIFLAQEIGDWQAFGDLCDAVPGLRPVVLSAFVSEQAGDYWRQQLGIGAKLPVLAAWSEPWAEGNPTPRRGFSTAAIKIPDSPKLLLIYNLHLKSNRSNSDEETQLNYRTREESIRQLLAHIQRMEEEVFPGLVAGVVIGGDFNTNRDGQFEDRTLEMLVEAGYHDTWKGVARAGRLTWRGSSRFEPTTFDHFFIKGLGTPTAKMLEVVDGTSDHWPVELEIQLPH